jgi:methylmalonyl-CoA mutase N-terminal domain/subunit
METRVRAILTEVGRRGGAARAIAQGYFQDEIAAAAYAAQRAIERGDEVVVGVNRFAVGGPPDAPPAPDYSALAAKQVERVGQLRASRDGARAQAALAGVTAAARAPDGALMEPIIEAVRARATVGEITAALESVWGRFERA